MNKRSSISLVMALGMTMAAQAFAQQNNGGPPPNDMRPPGPTQSLSDEQTEQVKAILSKYDPSILTADDAKAIDEALRAARVRPGPALDEAIRAAGFDPFKLRELAPPPPPLGSSDQNDNPPPPSPQTDTYSAGNQGQSGQNGPGPQSYSIGQAISGNAQLHTIAFNGLAFITGEFGASTLIPPGKVNDFFGFQYMRDIDAAGKGHNPMFLNRVAGNVIYVLNQQQRQLFFDLAEIQAQQLKSLALKRLPLIKAFHHQLDGKLPSGSSGLNREAVVRYVGELFKFDAELSYARAEAFGKVAASLSEKQKTYLSKMKFGDFNSWPDLDERNGIIRSKGHLFNVAYMTYASEFFSWYAGSVKADTYFCPERHGTYFGGFYMKDMPLMGKRDYDISTSITGDKGEAFLQVLNPEQRNHITKIIDLQRKPLEEIVQVRQAISTELRKFLQGKRADKSKVLALGKRYGELDGELAWLYATAFAKVSQTLTADQRTQLKKLRGVEGYKVASAYLYSSPMKEVPALPGTDRFFFAPKQL